MDLKEYLIGYGKAGDFGRFRPRCPLACRRGDRAVIQSSRGLELGMVLCEAHPGHAHFLPNTTVGQLLRLANAEDEQAAERQSLRGQRIFEDTQRLVVELGLPLEVLDVEVLLDARQAILHHLRWAECDPRPLLDSLADEFDLLVKLHDLALPSAAPETDEHEHGGCGREGCGSGGCASASTGACSSCGLKDLVKSRPGAVPEL